MLAGVLVSTKLSFSVIALLKKFLFGRVLVSKLNAYYFYIDLTGHQEDEAVQRALDELRARAAFFRCLGSYPSERAGVN